MASLKRVRGKLKMKLNFPKSSRFARQHNRDVIWNRVQENKLQILESEHVSYNPHYINISYNFGKSLSLLISLSEKWDWECSQLQITAHLTIVLKTVALSHQLGVWWQAIAGEDLAVQQCQQDPRVFLPFTSSFLSILAHCIVFSRQLMQFHHIYTKGAPAITFTPKAERSRGRLRALTTCVLFHQERAKLPTSLQQTSAYISLAKVGSQSHLSSDGD